MGPSDAVLWVIEQDPILRSTITAVALLDCGPDWEALRQKVTQATELMPRLRQRVVEASLPGDLPRWVEEPDLDLDYHLRRVRVPHPGSLRDLLDLATPITMQQFDHTRPLWEFTLVEGLESGRAALIQKLHHSITDGEGAIALALLLLDEERHPTPSPSVIASTATTAESSPVAASSVRDTLAGFRDEAGARLNGVASASAALVRGAAHTVTDPVRSVRDAEALARSMVKAVAPVSESASPIMRRRSMARWLDTIDLPLAELKVAAHAAGGTVNDAFLAAVVGGLARYHDHHRCPIESLRITMPISTRSAADPLSGNRFVPARFQVPSTIAEPAARIRAMGAVARSWQHEPFVRHSDTLATVLAHLPAAVTSDLMGSMLKHVDVVATNVAGLPSMAYLAGAQVIREYAFAPPAGAAVNVALLSHVDTACVGVVTDTAAVPDGALLMACFAASFDEVLALARPSKTGASSAHPA